jgi:hypothetical protein
MAKKLITEEPEDVKVLRRLADKERTLQRRQARWTKNFSRNNG